MPELRYFLRLNNQVSGPHTLVALREMASAHVFAPETLLTPEHSEAWTAIRDMPELVEHLFPGTRKLQLKAKPFATTPDTVTPISVDDILRANLRAELPQPASLSAPQRTPNNRRRDYLFAATACNGFGFALVWLLPRSPLIDVFLLSYFVLINIGLYWVYYHVMSRY